MNNNDTSKNVYRAKLLARRAIRLTTGDIPVATEVFLHNLDTFTLGSLRRAVEQGLVPSGLKILGDDEPTVVLRFTRTPEVDREQHK